MKTLPFAYTKFPNSVHWTPTLQFTRAALIRAVIAAGRNPNRLPKSSRAKAHITGLTSVVRSALDTSSSNLQATTYFQKLGSTEKTDMSRVIGNALCAHAAYQKVRVYWLADIERLSSKLVLQFKKGSKQRPDFIGKDNMNRWFVFESKGRTGGVTADERKDWKKQASRIRTINGSSPVYNVVSLSRLHASGWAVEWRDPPSEDGIDVQLDEGEFFEAYYQDIRSLVSNTKDLAAKPDYGPMVELQDSGVSVGLHAEILEALRKRDYASIVAFKRKGDDWRKELGRTGISVFADGVLVRIGRDPVDLVDSSTSILL